MSELPDPLSQILKDTADEPRVRRNWQGIESRQRRRSRRVLPAVIVVTAAAAAALLILLDWSQDDRPTPIAHPSDESVSPREVDAPALASGPIRLAEGGVLGALGPSEEAMSVALSDGSTLELSAGTRLEPVVNDSESMVWRQSEGAVRFSVRPGGPRQWVVDADLAEVTVVGTVFTVTRASDHVSVDVERDIVRVASDRLPEVARLMRGDSIRVDRVAVVADGNETVSLPPSPGMPSPRPAVEEDAEALMARADTARAAGNTERAAEFLEQAMARDGDPAAGIAAFTLGRLELDSLSRPAQAVTAFERAVALPLPSAMRESAEARLVEAYARAGRANDANRAAQEYLTMHPTGRHVDEVRARLGDP